MWCIFDLMFSSSLLSSQQRADADNDQINYCYHDSDLNKSDCQTNENAQDSERHSGCGQHQRHSHSENEKRQ